jgi:hypothetical protein
MSYRSLLLTSLLLAAACAGEADAPPPDESAPAEAAPAEEAASVDAERATLERLRASTARFADVEVALAEGYVPDPSGMCITAVMEGQPAEDGGMGIHYFRPDLLGLLEGEGRVNGTGVHTDFEQPGVLVYEPQGDGTMTLVAIENLVFQAAWNAAGHTAPPSFEGREYVSMVDDPATPADEAHGFEPHYELHIWTHRDNPKGAYVPFNPAVTCEYAAMAAMPAAG